MMSFSKMHLFVALEMLTGLASAGELVVTEPTVLDTAGAYTSATISAPLEVKAEQTISGAVTLSAPVTINSSGMFIINDYTVDQTIDGLGGFIADTPRTYSSWSRTWINVDNDRLSVWARRLTIPDTATTTAETFDVLTIRTNSTADVTIFNENTTKPVRVIFDGGVLRKNYDNSQGPTFSTSAGATTIAVATNGNNIVLLPHFSTRAGMIGGNGTFETQGDGNVVIAETGSNLPVPQQPVTQRDYDIYYYATNTGVNRSWVKIPSTGTVNWKHTGDFIIQGGGFVRNSRTNGLPYGVNTGVIRLAGWDSFACILGTASDYLTPLLDLNGYDAKVNGFNTYGIGRGCVTNYASAFTATLTFGSADDSNIITNTPFYGNINCVKVGSGTLTVADSDFGGAFIVSNGAVRIENGVRGSVTMKSLTVESGATLTIDGAEVFVETADTARGTVNCVNGARIVLRPTINGRAFHLDSVNVLPAQGQLRIQGGEYVFSGDLSTNEWWRWRIKKAYNNAGVVEVSRLALRNQATYDSAFNESRMYNEHFVNPQLSVSGTLTATAKDKWYVYADTPADAEMERGTMKVSENTSFKIDDSGARKYEDLSVLTDIRTVYEANLKGFVYNFYFSVANCKLDDESTWVDITMRLAEGKNAVRAWATGCTIWADGFFSDWELQSSPDGTNWETVNRGEGVFLRKIYHTDVGVSHSSWFNPYYGFALTEGHLLNAKGFDPTMQVRVDAGATLDCTMVTGGQEITKLEIDCETGAGTLEGVNLASSGTINFVNFSKSLLDTGVTLTLVDSAGADNLANWELTANGKTLPFNLRYADGKIYRNPAGMLIIVK